MNTIEHGTPSCYCNNHCRRPECRRAWALYMRGYRKLQTAKRNAAKQATP